MSCPTLPTLPPDLTVRFGQARGWNDRVSSYNAALCSALNGISETIASLNAAVSQLSGLESRLSSLEVRLEAVEESETETNPDWITVTTTPYTVSGIVGGLKVNTLSGAKTINLPAASGYLNRVLVIKDDTGDAATNNITVVPSGSETIDDDTVLVIDSGYASAQLKATATGWEIV